MNIHEKNHVDEMDIMLRRCLKNWSLTVKPREDGRDMLFEALEKTKVRQKSSRPFFSIAPHFDYMGFSGKVLAEAKAYSLRFGFAIL